MEIIKGEDLQGMQFVKDEEGRLLIYEPKGRFIPREGEDFWWFSEFGYIGSQTMNSKPNRQWLIQHHLVFRTEKECEDYKWFLEQLDKYSHEFSKDEWEDEDVYKWHFYYNYFYKEIGYIGNHISQHNNYYFTKESIVEFRKTVGDERIKKYMFDVWE